MTSIARKYGWKPDLPDHRDRPHLFLLPGLASRPDHLDLSSGFPLPYDQGELGSCTANAIAGVVEYDEIKQKKNSPSTPSRLFIYFNERAMEGSISYDSGAMIRDGIKSLNTLGYCEETLWPYDIKKFAQRPKSAAYRDAARCRVDSYERVSQNLISIQTALAAGNPVVFGFSVYEAFESQAMAHSGMLHVPAPTERLLGGHAVVLVGYDNAKGMFLVRNSWGVNWGLKGHFWVDYAYVTNPKLANDFWVVKFVPQLG